MYREPVQLPISIKIYEACLGFANAQMETGSGKLYDNRSTKSLNRSSIIDITYGKIGECLTAQFIHQYYNLPLISPDFTIYTTKQKSWKNDLIYPNWEVCVKSTNKLIYQNQPSWIFQYSNPNRYGGKDKIFSEYKDNTLVSLVYIDMLNKYGYIYGLFPFKILIEKNLFKNPLSSKLFNIKLALYTNDLRQSISIINMWRNL